MILLRALPYSLALYRRVVQVPAALVCPRALALQLRARIDRAITQVSRAYATVPPTQASAVGTATSPHPRCLIEAVLFGCHCTPSAGHQCIRCTSSIVHESFYWNGWKGDVTSFVQNCEKCQQFSGGLYSKRGEVTPELPVTATLFNKKVSLDIAGPYHISDRGNTNIVVMQDKFSHLACVVAIPDTSAETVARAFINSCVESYSAPLNVITDNGRNLVGAITSDVCKILSSHMITTSPYNPKANPIERFNHTFNSMVAKFVNASQ
jgi:hypothetical protein